MKTQQSVGRITEVLVVMATETEHHKSSAMDEVFHYMFLRTGTQTLCLCVLSSINDRGHFKSSFYSDTEHSFVSWYYCRRYRQPEAHTTLVIIPNSQYSTINVHYQHRSFNERDNSLRNMVCLRTPKPSNTSGKKSHAITWQLKPFIIEIHVTM